MDPQLKKDSIVTFRKVIQAHRIQDPPPPSRPQTAHPLSLVWVSVQAGDHDQCCPWMSRRWKCCCVGWHATETQHLHGWDFLLGSALQLDTETAVNQSPSSCVYHLYYGGGGLRFVCMACKNKKDKKSNIKNKTKQQQWLLKLKENISFIKIPNKKTSTRQRQIVKTRGGFGEAAMCWILCYIPDQFVEGFQF